jgi:hypothetical protein
MYLNQLIFYSHHHSLGLFDDGIYIRWRKQKYNPATIISRYIIIEFQHCCGVVMNQKNFEFSRIAESSILPKKISGKKSCLEVGRDISIVYITAIQRLKLNLVTICVVNYISNISIFIVSPSLHQFVKGNSSDDTVKQL